MGGVSKDSILLDVGCGAGGASLVASTIGATVKSINATPRLSGLGGIADGLIRNHALTP